MTLTPLIVLICITLLIGLLAKGSWRSWFLMTVSIVVIYWLQPASPIRHLDFWLPTACLFLVIITWSLTKSKDSQILRLDLMAGLIIALVILAIGLTRYLGPLCCLTPTRPPTLFQIVLIIVATSLIAYMVSRLVSGRVAWIYGSITLIVVIFVILKSDLLSMLMSKGLRSLTSQSIELASPIDLRWFGFSYVAFRLIHTLRDRISGKLPGVNLMEYVTYIIFYPAFTAGPIDRVQRFVQDLRQPFHLSLETTLSGGKRILLGIFRKFVLADGLTLIALNSSNSAQVRSTGWLWVILYAYALRIYFDFSGYTDIAIGLGQMLGIQLPENFEKPYLKQNLTLFWNSWHITLAQWFRAYFFNPLTRSIRASPRHVPLPLIIFVGQLSTFLLIGLWHGISWNYAIWGAWHGIGLFVHNRWSGAMQTRNFILDTRPRIKQLVSVSSTLLTFHYVSLGWVWFALSSPAQSWHTFLKLFGLS